MGCANVVLPAADRPSKIITQKPKKVSRSSGSQGMSILQQVEERFKELQAQDGNRQMLSAQMPIHQEHTKQKAYDDFFRVDDGERPFKFEQLATQTHILRSQEQIFLTPTLNENVENYEQQQKAPKQYSQKI